MKVTEFYKTDYVDYSSYDNLRKIASLMDGLKNASRKIVRTVLDKRITTDIKVSQLNSKMAEYCEYLHGDASSAIVTIAQNFVGTNNLNVLEPAGNFGTRFIKDASASRYIYTHGTETLWNNFKVEDNNILISQFFEGHEIEPKFYVPALPMLLINGSMGGVSSGFAQDILPRNPVTLRKYLIDTLNGKNTKRIPFNEPPHFNGFLGTIIQGETSRQWIIKGTANRISANTVIITEIPIGYGLKSYIKILDELEEKAVIKSYKDNSDAKTDTFNFEVKFNTNILKELTDDKLTDKLKLNKKVSEIYTAMDETNTIKVFENINDIFWHYYNVKLLFLQTRKDYLIKKYEQDIRADVSRYTFIKMIVDEELIINKRKKAEIVIELKSINNIILRDNSYDYLLNMPISSLTEERMTRLLQDIKDKKTLLDHTKNTTLENMWLADLNKDIS